MVARHVGLDILDLLMEVRQFVAALPLPGSSFRLRRHSISPGLLCADDMSVRGNAQEVDRHGHRVPRDHRARNYQHAVDGLRQAKFKRL